MLKNKKIVYFCQECGYESSKWMGQCPGCKAWNTLVEETISTKKGTSSGIGSFQNSGKRPEPVRLKDISLSEDERQLTKIGELDRVLGAESSPGLWFWWVEIRESENPPFFYRYAEIWHSPEEICCIFPERNPCIRLSFGQSGSENLTKIFSFCVRQIWKRFVK